MYPTEKTKKERPLNAFLGQRRLLLATDTLQFLCLSICFALSGPKGTYFLNHNPEIPNQLCIEWSIQGTRGNYLHC